MNSLFQKISIFILIAVCVILVVDKTRQSLHLNGVATRIAEKTAELERTKTEFTVVREKLQNEIRERDDRFRLLPRRTTEKKGVPQPADPQDSEFLQMSAALSKNAASPGQLLWSFKKIAEEKHLLPDTFRIDPVTGLVVSRAASLLSSAAKSAGMDVNTSLIWDMRDFHCGLWL